MNTAIINNETNKYEVEFTTSGSDVIQTEAQAYIYVYAKLDSDHEHNWCKVGQIASKDRLTLIDIAEGITVKLQSSKPFNYELKVD